MHKLDKNYKRGPTVVIEAAFFLLREGLLNVPDLGVLNVKQARAFLWNAAWLQEYMNRRWPDEQYSCSDALRPKIRQAFASLCLAIIGPGGTGKTAVLKLAETC